MVYRPTAIYLQSYYEIKIFDIESRYQQKSSAHLGLRVNPVLARNSCIYCNIS